MNIVTKAGHMPQTGRMQQHLTMQSFAFLFHPLTPCITQLCIHGPSCLPDLTRGWTQAELTKIDAHEQDPNSPQQAAHYSLKLP